MKLRYVIFYLNTMQSLLYLQYKYVRQRLIGIQKVFHYRTLPISFIKRVYEARKLFKLFSCSLTPYFSITLMLLPTLSLSLTLLASAQLFIHPRVESLDSWHLKRANELMTDCPSERIRPNLTCRGLFTFLLFSFWNWKTFTAVAVAVAAVVVALLLRLAVKIIANYGQQLAASNVGYAAVATCKTRKKQQRQQQQKYQQHYSNNNSKNTRQQLKHIVYNAFFIWESRVLPF